MRAVVEQGPAFGVLGTLEFRRDGAPAPLPGGRRRAVLAALLVGVGGPVSADALVEAGWGAAAPADPQAALHTVLSRLRAILGPGVLATEPAGYRLAVAPEMIDAARFEALRAGTSDRPPSEALALLDEALGLWRGPAYAEFADHDFARAEAARLNRLRAESFEDRAALALELGRPGEACAAMEDLVTREPFRERARSLLIRALYESGRQTEALDSYRSYRTMLADELGLDPSPMLAELHNRILGHDLPAAASSRPDREAIDTPQAWPTGLDSFIGREADMARLLDVAAAHRLTCVTGPGGVGKTRLVAEATSALAERLGTPIVVVELAAVGEGQVDAAVARALHLGPSRLHPRDRLLDYLRVAPFLLVLDNCEHVLAETRALVHAIGRDCPRVRVLATSRRRLSGAGEQVLPLEPLPVPRPGDTPSAAALSAAVRLFADRLRAARPSFDLTGESLVAAAEVCRGLDGLPLALELAASRAAMLGLPSLPERISEEFDLLGEDVGLQAVVGWSFDLLDVDEQALLEALSVFDGAFDLDAAAQVATMTSVASGLARLVEASLLGQVEVGGATRYRMLGIVRRFAAERLARAGRHDSAQAARAGWARSLAGECAAAVIGPRSAAAFTRLDRGLDDLTRAASWCLQQERLDLAAQIIGPLGLCPHGLPSAEHYQLASQLAAQPGVLDTPTAALALGAGAEAAVQLGDLEQAQRFADIACLRAESPAERYLALLSLGIASLYLGEYDRARTCWQELLATSGLPAAYRADGHGCLALLHSYHGERADARDHAAAAREAADTADAIAFRAFATYVTGEVLLADDPRAAVMVLREATALADRAGRTSAGHVGVVARIALLSALTRQGHDRAAVELAPQVLRSQLQAGTWPQLWTTARILAELFADLGHYSLAQLLLATAEAAPSAPLLLGADVARYRDLDSQLRGHLSADAITGIIALAGCLSRAEVIARAESTLHTLAGISGAGMVSSWQK